MAALFRRRRPLLITIPGQVSVQEYCRARASQIGTVPRCGGIRVLFVRDTPCPLQRSLRYVTCAEILHHSTPKHGNPKVRHLAAPGLQQEASFWSSGPCCPWPTPPQRPASSQEGPTLAEPLVREYAETTEQLGGHPHCTGGQWRWRCPHL